MRGSGGGWGVNEWICAIQVETGGLGERAGIEGTGGGAGMLAVEHECPSPSWQARRYCTDILA